MQRICTSLVSAGYLVELVGRKFSTSPSLIDTNYVQKRLNCWFKRGKFFYFEYNIRLFLFLLFTRADCICAIDLDTIIPCWVVSKLKGIKRVYDAHEYFSQLYEVVSRPTIYQLWHWIEKKMIPRFKNGYTVCQSIADEFSKEHGVVYEVIRNVPVLNELKISLGNEKIILYQGAVNKGRDLDKLAESMKSVDAELWIYGNGNYMAEMKRVVEKNNITDKVKFFGMLSPSELKSKITQAYLAVNLFGRKGLNQYLSLANKFFDYIHAGIPQVTMNYPEYQKINQQYEIAILIDDTDPAEIAGAINKLLNDQMLYKRLKENCLKAREELNWQKEERKLISFYRNLFNE